MRKDHVIRGASDLLALAAAPVFIAMALLTATFHGDLHMASSQSPLVGMATMYALMGLFHSPPWLKLISRRTATGDCAE